MKKLDTTEQLNNLLQFFQITHSSLFSEEKNKFCIEIRPITRSGYNYTLSKSINIWNFDEKTKQKLLEFLDLHNGTECCLYYSVYTFDYDKNSYRKDGKAAQKGKINSDNSEYTEELVLDFDNIKMSEWVKISKQLNDINLSGLWVFSGHGYQLHLLLNNKLFDKNALYQIVYTMRSKGFNCDPSCIDPSRIMRLPFTYNCKCFNTETYSNEKDNPPYCEVVDDTNIKYSFEEIIEKLSSLQTINQEEENKLINKQTKDTVKVDKVIYPYLDKHEIPAPITKMLTRTPAGFRNKVLGFLIKYFKFYLKLSKNQIEEILYKWAEFACVPPYDDFYKDFNRLYFGNGLNFDTTLAKEFGFIDFQDYATLEKQYILVPNDILADEELDGKYLRMFLSIKLLEHIQKQTDIDNIAAALDISTRAAHTTLQVLRKSKYIYMSKCNRTKKIPNTYHSSKIFSPVIGFTKLSFNDIKAYIDELGNNELKLYMFMNYKFFSNNCYMSQNNLGNAIGVKQNTISGLVKTLEQKYFLRIEKKPVNEYIFYNNYIMLR